MNQPEKLNLWDRFFNRTRREVAGRGQDDFVETCTIYGVPMNTRNFVRDWVDYRIIDRLTGSEIIKREYLN